MAKSDSVVFANVNGFPLYLKVDSRIDPPKSKHFIISYKTKENKSIWPWLLFLALVFHIIALCAIIVTISVTTILVILIILSFLLLFYMTRCVQSGSYQRYLIFGIYLHIPIYNSRFSRRLGRDYNI